jgi:tRNA (guanine37-N1)-methyltransferase
LEALPFAAREFRRQILIFDIITIFPDFFRGPLDHGILRRAREDRHRTVDDRPFGGGEGMVLKPEPLFECVESLLVSERTARRAGSARESVILLSPQGRKFNQAMAYELAALERLVLICGRYEGVDERVAQHLCDREVSMGDYILSGGELGAAIIVDAAARLLPGALGNEASARQESFTAGHPQPLPGSDLEGPSSTCASGGLLDYPHYTRPADFRGMGVPEVLLSGDHEQIRRWRRSSALQKTLRNRPDLLEGADLNREDQELIARLSSETI